MRIARSQFSSLAIHILLLLLLLAASREIRPPRQTPPGIAATHLTFYRPPPAANSRSGGSNQTPLPARHGSPPPTARRTFIPPAAPDHAPLTLPITISFDIPTADSTPDIGDPLSKLSTGALGSHGANSIGDRGGCCGIGDSNSGPPGLSVVRGRGVKPPQLIHKVEPEFSEQARKAKYQGIVVLAIDVDPGGNVRNIRVRQSLGLGLDEKAVEAVAQWRFRPGVLNGKPVTTEAIVQVSFQLL